MRRHHRRRGSFTFGQAASDVLTKGEQETLDQIITQQIVGGGSGASGGAAVPGSRAAAWQVKTFAELDEELVCRAAHLFTRSCLAASLQDTPRPVSYSP